MVISILWAKVSLVILCLWKYIPGGALGSGLTWYLLSCWLGVFLWSFPQFKLWPDMKSLVHIFFLYISYKNVAPLGSNITFCFWYFISLISYLTFFAKRPEISFRSRMFNISQCWPIWDITISSRGVCQYVVVSWHQSLVWFVA